MVRADGSALLCSFAYDTETPSEAQQRRAKEAADAAARAETEAKNVKATVATVEPFAAGGGGLQQLLQDWVRKGVCATRMSNDGYWTYEICFSGKIIQVAVHKQ